MKAAILGRKVGMTTLYSEEGKQVPVTMLQAGTLSSSKSQHNGKRRLQGSTGWLREVAEKKVNKQF